MANKACKQGNGSPLKMQLKSLKVASNLTKGGAWVNKVFAYLAGHCSYIRSHEFVMKIVNLQMSKTVSSWLANRVTRSSTKLEIEKTIQSRTNILSTYLEIDYILVFKNCKISTGTKGYQGLSDDWGSQLEWGWGLPPTAPRCAWLEAQLSSVVDRPVRTWNKFVHFATEYAWHQSTVTLSAWKTPDSSHNITYEHPYSACGIVSFTCSVHSKPVHHVSYNIANRKIRLGARTLTTHGTLPPWWILLDPFRNAVLNTENTNWVSNTHDRNI